MSEYIPNTTIGFIAGYPCTNNYENTIRFTGVAQQTKYFSDRVILWAGTSSLTGGNYSYQRVNKNTINIGCKIEDIIYCNYMMFKNTEFENKWFYAFVTSIDYVNNNVTKITYEVDVIQTWMFQFTFKQCFVEREHSLTDNIGDNIVPEQLEIGDYIFEDQGATWQNCNGISDFSICIAAPWERVQDTDLSWLPPIDAEPGFYNGVYSGLHYTTFPLNVNNSILEQTLNEFMGHMEDTFWQTRRQEIVSIFMVPTDIVTNKGRFPYTSSEGVVKKIDAVESWPNYTPKNKKLFTFPYNCIYVTSSDGDSAYYKYELFPMIAGTRLCRFAIEGCMGLPPEILLSPVIYNYDYSGSSYIQTGLTVGETAPTSLQLVVNAIGIDHSNFNQNKFLGKKLTFAGSNKFYTVVSCYESNNLIYFTLDKNLSATIASGTIVLFYIAINYNFSLRLHNFPMCSWITEPFKEWLAQNTTSLLARGGLAVASIGIASTVAGLATGTTAGDAASGLVSGMKSATIDNMISSSGSVGSLIGEASSAMLQPDQANGSSRGILPVSNNEFGYHFYNAHIRPQFAKIIDDYFTMYGYAVREVKTPYIKTRKYWNYIKTIGCTISPIVAEVGSNPQTVYIRGINSEDTAIINSIFDKGITFWHAITNQTTGAVNVDVGNYSLNNELTGVAE